MFFVIRSMIIALVMAVLLSKIGRFIVFVFIAIVAFVIFADGSILGGEE